MSILRAALVGSTCAIPPCCRPISATHLCRKTASHPLLFTPNNAAPRREQQQHFRVWASSPRFSSSSTSSYWRLHRWETNPPSPFWTRVVSPVADLVGGSDSRGEGFACRGRGGDIWKGAGENSSSPSSLLKFSDHCQQRPYSTAARNRQPAAAAAAAAAGCFSALWGRRMSSRGHGGEAESVRRRIPSANQAGRAFAEQARQGNGGAPLTDLEKDNFKEVDIEPPKKLLTLPTVLTLARVAAVPAILAVFYSKEPWATSAAAVIFVLAAVTDWLDGYLARKMGTSSAFGAFLDPVADKLMVAAALVLLCTKPLADADLAAIPWLLPLPTIAIIGREITMSAVREWAAAQGGELHKAVAVNNLGKVKTVAQMVSITLLLASGEGGLDSRIAGVVGVGLLYVAAILALWSLAMYMRGIWGSMFR